MRVSLRGRFEDSNDEAKINNYFYLSPPQPTGHAWPQWQNHSVVTHNFSPLGFRSQHASCSATVQCGGERNDSRSGVRRVQGVVPAAVTHGWSVVRGVQAIDAVNSCVPLPWRPSYASCRRRCWALSSRMRGTAAPTSPRFLGTPGTPLSHGPTSLAR